MSTAFEEEEDLAPAYPPHDRYEQPGPPDREITLSSSTLLGIFFALVLICGLFFGLGYTFGRRAPAEAAEAATAPTVASPVPASNASPKPSASQTEAVPAAHIAADTESSTAEPVTADESTPPATVQQAALPARPAYVSTQTAAPAANAAPIPVPAVTAPTAPDPTPATRMVQIAAVSNPADADVLVGALRKHGYSITVRHEPGDSLLHVQVGPFSTRAEAVAMRQKLLSDGYNAILK